ncbi:MAG: Pr6Pr family membrane protein, partial [Caldilineaceae bacterium]
MSAVRQIWTRWFRLAFALLGLVTIVYQFPHTTALRGGAINTLSYFTYAANIIGVSVLFWTAMSSSRQQPTLASDMLRGAAVTYLGLTGIVYPILLAGTASIWWTDKVMHVVMPLVMVADWLIDPPRPALTYRKALWWLVFPLAWLAYTLVRGSITGWYPYGFLNPSLPNTSWVSVLTMCGALLVTFLVLGMLVTWIGRLMYSV